MGITHSYPVITMRWHRPSTPSLRVTIAVALTLTIATAVVAVIAGTGGDSAPPSHVVTGIPLTWRAGACVRREERALALARCDDASGRVLTVGSASPGAEPPCPADTDEFAAITHDRVACVRNLRAPHPGDPGQGGGLLRAGDCVTRSGEEWPCARTGWYGRVVARTTSGRDCPPAADP